MIARHACEIGSGRVGRSRVAEDPVLAAVVAHGRHHHTDYDALLDETRGPCYGYFDRRDARDEARSAVAGQIGEVLRRWEQAPTGGRGGLPAARNAHSDGG